MHQVEAGSLFIYGLTKTANPLEIGFWFFTPGVWIFTFVVVLIGLLLAGILKKNKQLDYTVLFTIGGLFALFPIVFNFIHFNNWVVFLETIALIAIVSYGICKLIDKYTKYKIFSDPINLFIVTGQAIDGIASSIAITFFNFSEQHVVSNMVMNIHPALFVLIKVILSILICWSLDDYLKDEKKEDKKHLEKMKNKKNLVGFIKVIIAILGFATGLASLFKLGII